MGDFRGKSKGIVCRITFRGEKMKILGKRSGVIVGTLLLSAVIHLGSVGAADLKIGSINMEKAVNECGAGKDAKKAIQGEIERFQHLAVEKQKELQDARESLEKQWPMLNPETRSAKEKEYQAKLRDLQRWGEDGKNEIEQKRLEMERKIYVGLQSVIQKVGAEEGYTFILEKNENIVLFTSQSIDITDRVIKTYDAQKK